MPLTPKQKLAQYDAALRLNQKNLLRVTQRGGAARMKKLYDRAQSELVAKIRHQVRSGKGSSYSADKHRVVLSMVRQGQAVLTHRLTGELNTVSREAQTDGVHTANETLSKLRRDFDDVDAVLPSEEASVFQRLVDKRRGSLLRQHEESMRNYGGRVVTAIEQELSTSLLQQETPLQAIDRVQSVADGEWWQGERIVRTECAGAYNLAHHDAYKEAQEDIPDLWMRWSEHCSDTTGEPLDDRVAIDSEWLNAQVVPVGGVFRLPRAAASEVSAKLMAGSWEAPPDRPNGREVLQPWRRDWGVPGYQLVGGRQVWLVPLGG